MGSSQQTRSMFVAAGLWLTLLLWTAVTFAPALSGRFLHWDDYALVVGNPQLTPARWASVRYFWTHRHVGLYTPAAYSLWTLVAWIAPPATASAGAAGRFHLLNLLLWLMTAGVVFWLLHQLAFAANRGPTQADRPLHEAPAHSTHRWVAAFLGASLFILHPLQVEPVAWISGMNNLLATLLSMGAVSAYVAAARRKRRWIYGLATILFAAALLSKPTAIVTPFLAIAIDRSLLGRSWRSIALASGPWLMMAVVVAFIARAVQPPPFTSGQPIWFRGAVAVDALDQFLAKLVWPIDLCPDYGRSPTWLANSAALRTAWIAPLLLGLTAMMLRRRCAALAAGLLMFLAALLPTLGLVPFEFQSYSTVADRYVNLALIGPALLLTFAAARWPRIVIGPAVVGLLALSIITHNDSENWIDDTALVNRTLAVNPQSLMANRVLTATLLDAGKIDEAEAFAERVVAFHPESPGAKLTLAAVRRAAGDLPAAEALYRAALVQRPDFALAEANLASVLAERGQFDEALPHAQAAVKLDPNDPMSRQTLGRLLEHFHRLPEAIEQLRVAVQIAPADTSTRIQLATMLAAIGCRGAAMHCLEQALELNPHDAAARRALAALQR